MLVRVETWAHLLAHHQQTPKRAPSFITASHSLCCCFGAKFKSPCWSSCDAMRCGATKWTHRVTPLAFISAFNAAAAAAATVLCYVNGAFDGHKLHQHFSPSQHSTASMSSSFPVSYQISFDNRHEEDNNRTRQ